MPEEINGLGSNFDIKGKEGHDISPKKISKLVIPNANNAWEIMKLMEEINEQGTTVVVVTHNLEIVKAMNKRVITMQKGVVVDDTASDHYGKDTSVEQDDDLFDDFLDDGGDDDYAD